MSKNSGKGFLSCLDQWSTTVKSGKSKSIILFWWDALMYCIFSVNKLVHILVYRNRDNVMNLQWILLYCRRPG